jgi:hypothetical protein
MITPVLLARRWTRTGSIEGRGGGPAGADAVQAFDLPGVRGFLRVRSSSRVARS